MQPLKKLWAILEPRQRRGALALLFFMLIGMVLETFSIGLVLPAIAAMTTPDLLARYPMVSYLLAPFGAPTQPLLVAVGMLFLLSIYLIKTGFLLFLFWSQAKFVFRLHASLCQRLFENYLLQPYAFHLKRNSAQLLHAIITEVNIFTNAAQASMVMLTEALVIAGIFILLLFVEPWAAILVGVLLPGAGALFYRGIRDRLLNWGKLKRIHDGLRVQHVQQGLGGVKDIKLLGRETEFLAQFRTHNRANAWVLQHQYFLQQTPRLLLEVLAVCGLGLVVWIMIGQGQPLDLLLPVLGLFGAAAFRLMPSVNRIVSSAQTTRFGVPVIDGLHRELIEQRAPRVPKRAQALPFRRQIALENVVFHYAEMDRPALQNVSLSIARGASVGLVGDSGGGKSTLVDVILGLLTPTSGRVLVDGVDIQTDLRAWQSQIGYVPQAIFLTDDTLRRNVAFGLADTEIDTGAVWRAIRAARLEDFVNSLPQRLDTLVGERGVRLSGGQRQRVGIARALYHDPEVLVLDEATSSLDTATEQGVMEAIDALHATKTLIIVAHRLSTMEGCDVRYVIKAGQVTLESDRQPAALVGD